jgi:hypothetical protein
MDLGTFAIDVYEEPPQAVVLRLVGEFDLVGEPALQEALDGLGKRSGRSLVVDVSEAPFIAVGSLRRIVFAGRGFAATEFRSPVPIVEKVLRLLGFIDGTVRIEGEPSGTISPCSLDEVASMERSTEPRWNAPENEWMASRVSRQCSDARGALKHRVVDLGSSGRAAAAVKDAYSSPQSLEQK